MDIEKHYALFSCDRHHSQSSMRLIGVYTWGKLVKRLKRGVEKKEFNIEQEYFDKLGYPFNPLYFKQIFLPFGVNCEYSYVYVKPLPINEDI